MKWPIDPKDQQYKYLDASVLVHEGPCLLVSAHITQESTQRYMRIYNGIDSNADPVIDLQGGSKSSTNFRPQPPLYLRNGIYAYVEGSIKSATIVFVPLQQGE
jgi:hypothetical protein